MIWVLFICLGNICRSPSAQGVFNALVRRENLADKIAAESCGTSTWHIGSPPDVRARAEARRRGISIDDLRARQLTEQDFEIFQYILVMDRANMATVRKMAPEEHRSKIRLVLDFAPELPKREVLDPYYGGPEGFARVFDMLEAAAQGLLADIRQHHLGE